MIGILTEKPSQMRKFAKALGGSSGVYKGEQYVLACARGHMYELVDPAKQVSSSLVEKYKSWNLSNLPWNEQDFHWIKAPKEGTTADLHAIKNAFVTCDELVYGGDLDPSGEGFMISYEIFSALSLKPKKWSRMYFIDESEKSIREAFETRKAIPVPERNEEYMMANYRGAWDFCSMQWTRIATKCGDGKSVLRQGRLKSCMVLLVGDALKALASYKKVPFYQNRFRDENGVMYTNPDEPMFKTKNEVPKDYHTSDVVVDSKDMKKSAPPMLLDLASLAARLTPKGATAKQVLDTYQKMYEAQVVSYPRTEDKNITPEQFNELLPLVDKIANVVGVDASLLTHRQPRSTHVMPKGAHGANRPGTNVPTQLSALQQYGPWAEEIYALLAESYLAMLAEDYEYEFQKGHVKDYPDFKGTASVPKKLGWKKVFCDADDDVVQDDTAKGLGKTADPFVFEGFPPKPPVPTTNWLMKQLKRLDIGTGSTRLSTYSDVTSDKVKYPLMEEKKGKLSMTSYGDMSYRLLPGTNIASLDVTARLQAEMKDVASGKRSFDECLHDIQRMIIEDIPVMQKNGEAMRKELGLSMAGTGNGTGTDAERYEGTWNGKAVKFKREWSGHRFTDEECEALCKGEDITISAVSKNTGKEFMCHGCLEEQTYNNRKYVGFKNKGFVNANGKSDEIPESWCSHEFTAVERDALESGLSIEADDFVSKKGKTFSAKVHWGKNEKGYMAIIPEF